MKEVELLSQLGNVGIKEVLLVILVVGILKIVHSLIKLLEKAYGK